MSLPLFEHPFRPNEWSITYWRTLLASRVSQR